MNEFFVTLVFGKPAWMWLVFLAIVFILLVLDLGVFNRKSRALTVRQSLRMSAFYVAIGMAFSAFVWWALGEQAGKDYLNGYVVEETLSMDNLFVMSVIFSYFAIPRPYQYRVLFWGILGVVVLRALMIAAGAELLQEFEWTMYAFSLFLIFTGIKMLMSGEHEPDMGKNRLLKFIKRKMRITPELHGNKFFVRQKVAGKMLRCATPLLMALVVIECVDLVFALDSVPAIFAITQDTYVVYTSNIFAILGLRALYFALSAMMHRFEYLKYSLAVLLIFIGGKIFIADALGWDEFPHSLSLAVTFLILGVGVAYSWKRTKAARSS